MESLRMCCVCRQMKSKDVLIRVVKNKENEIFIDKSKKADGRGAYVCNEQECLNKLKKTRALNKAFRGNVSEEIYEELIKSKEC